MVQDHETELLDDDHALMRLVEIPELPPHLRRPGFPILFTLQRPQLVRQETIPVQAQLVQALVETDNGPLTPRQLLPNSPFHRERANTANDA